MPKDEVLQHLHFESTQVRAYSEYDTGTLSVTAEMKPASIYIDGIDYFVDGSLTAEIYDGEEKVGEATLVLPMYGSNLDNHYRMLPHINWKDRKKVIKLEGLCLYCKAAKNKGWDEFRKWTVKIVPGKYLWAMENLSEFDKSQIDRA